ncbi:MAG: hypothetical protein RMI91_05305 [Gemmatales bacterium]|nr:hypothetical protein [Gemmatales bacterium]MDW7994052.1 hypothetical protein [Gemmatales bacterium]
MLSMSDTRFTDAGLRDLAVLKNFTELDLWRTGICNAGLKNLAALKGLARLNLYPAKIPELGS